MFKKFFLKLLVKYQWLFNPLVENNHEISILMANLGFKRTKRRELKSFKIFYDEGRLIGGFQQIIKGLFSTHVEIIVYERLYTPQTTDKNNSYRLAVIFSHSVGEDLYQVSTRIATEFFTFKQLSVFLNSISDMSESRAFVFDVQQKSKKNKDAFVNTQ